MGVKGESPKASIVENKIGQYDKYIEIFPSNVPLEIKYCGGRVFVVLLIIFNTNVICILFLNKVVIKSDIKTTIINTGVVF